MSSRDTITHDICHQACIRYLNCSIQGFSRISSLWHWTRQRHLASHLAQYGGYTLQLTWPHVKRRQYSSSLIYGPVAGNSSRMACGSIHGWHQSRDCWFKWWYDIYSSCRTTPSSWLNVGTMTPPYLRWKFESGQTLVDIAVLDMETWSASIVSYDKWQHPRTSCHQTSYQHYWTQRTWGSYELSRNF